jgi:hypothetical protein
LRRCPVVERLSEVDEVAHRPAKPVLFGNHQHLAPRRTTDATHEVVHPPNGINQETITPPCGGVLSLGFGEVLGIPVVLQRWHRLANTTPHLRHTYWVICVHAG